MVGEDRQREGRFSRKELLAAEAAQPKALEQTNPFSVQTPGIGRSAQRRLRLSTLEGAAR